MFKRKLTPLQASKEINIHFNCSAVSPAVLIEFDVFAVADGRRTTYTDMSTVKVVELTEYYMRYWYQVPSLLKTEEVIIYPAESTLSVDSITPDTTLLFTLKKDTKSDSFQDFLTTLQTLRNNDLLKDFISVGSLRRLSDTDLLCLGKFAISKSNDLQHEITLSSFLAAATNFRTKKTEKVTYMYKVFRNMVIQVIMSCQLSLYQEELKSDERWTGLNWERVN